MKLIVNGSGSTGNSYVLESDNGEVLILECGIKSSEIKKSINYNLKNIVGVAVSHSHL